MRFSLIDLTGRRFGRLLVLKRATQISGGVSDNYKVSMFTIHEQAVKANEACS
jgi:hypothetical protein